MRITLTISVAEDQNDDAELLALEVYPEMDIGTLKNSVHVETGFEPSSQHLYHNGQHITDNSKTLSELQIGDGEMLALHVRELRGSIGIPAGGANPPAQQGGSRGGASASAPQQDPETIRLQLLGDPNLRAELSSRRPELASVLEDPQRFNEVWAQSYDRERRERAARHQQIQMLNSDPFNPEAQAKIEEIIRQERVMENLQNAMEHNPEVFGHVHMLYLNVEVNGYKFKALVDSGAQATIMSPSCAEACGIMRLVDKRFAGVAKGVGVANIIGRVHSAQIKIGPLFLPCSFTVMEGKAVELLLGLDMLKRHQASIDLAKDKLIIQGVEVPFLGESEIPKDSEEAYQAEEKVPGPAGTTIGARSGAVTAPSEPAGRSTSGAPQAGPSGPSGVPPARTFPREHIDQLKALGSSEEKAIQALEATGGNVEFAASLIFSDE